MDNIIQLHIWQLSEKIDSIDRDNDIIMIHDRYALKKTSIKNLFEYLNQDYKVDSTVAFFEKQMKDFDDKYNVLYASLEVSLDEYDEIIEELEAKFTTNRDNIRALETDMNKMYNTLISIDTDMKTVDNKQSILFDTLNNFSAILTDLDKRLTDAGSTLDEYDNRIDEITDLYTEIASNTQSLETKIEDLQESITADNSDKSNELLNKINSEYDKILAILDYYHHIHEDFLLDT